MSTKKLFYFFMCVLAKKKPHERVGCFALKYTFTGQLNEICVLVLIVFCQHGVDQVRSDVIFVLHCPKIRP